MSSNTAARASAAPTRADRSIGSAMAAASSRPWRWVAIAGHQPAEGIAPELPVAENRVRGPRHRARTVCPRSGAADVGDPVVPRWCIPSRRGHARRGHCPMPGAHRSQGPPILRRALSLVCQHEASRCPRGADAPTHPRRARAGCCGQPQVRGVWAARAPRSVRAALRRHDDVGGRRGEGLRGDGRVTHDRDVGGRNPADVDAPAGAGRAGEVLARDGDGGPGGPGRRTNTVDDRRRAELDEMRTTMGEVRVSSWSPSSSSWSSGGRGASRPSSPR